MAVLRGGPSIDLFVEAFGMAVSTPLEYLCLQC